MGAAGKKRKKDRKEMIHENEDMEGAITISGLATFITLFILATFAGRKIE